MSQVSNDLQPSQPLVLPETSRWLGWEVTQDWRFITLVAALAATVIAAVVCYFNADLLSASIFTLASAAQGLGVYHYLQSMTLSDENRTLRTANTSLQSQNTAISTRLAEFERDDDRVQQVQQLQILRQNTALEGTQIQQERATLETLRTTTTEVYQRLHEALTTAHTRLAEQTPLMQETVATLATLLATLDQSSPPAAEDSNGYENISSRPLSHEQIT